MLPENIYQHIKNIYFLCEAHLFHLEKLCVAAFGADFYMERNPGFYSFVINYLVLHQVEYAQAPHLDIASEAFMRHRFHSVLDVAGLQTV